MFTKDFTETDLHKLGFSTLSRYPRYFDDDEIIEDKQFQKDIQHFRIWTPKDLKNRDGV